MIFFGTEFILLCCNSFIVHQTVFTSITGRPHTDLIEVRNVRFFGRISIEKNLTNDIYAFLGKLFEYWRLLIGCSSESTNQSEVSKIWKGHQNGKNMIWFILTSFWYILATTGKSPILLILLSQEQKLSYHIFFHLDCMHLWILWSISLLGHKSFVFGWQKKIFLFWNRPGLEKNWETKRCGQHSIMWWIMWNTTQSRYIQNRKTPTHWISTLNIIRRREFKNKRSSQFWIYT